MYSVWLTDVQQQLWRDHLAMAGGLQAAMNRQLHQACGLTLADYDVLVALSERGDLRIGELAAALGWEQSRLSHQLRRMRDRGLVSRAESPDDGRGAMVGLTASGRTQLRVAAPGHAELVRTLVFDGMTGGEAAAVRSWMARVLARLE